MFTCREGLKLGVGIAGLLVLLLTKGIFSPVQAQDDDVRVGDPVVQFSSEMSHWKDCGLRKVDVNAFTSVRPEAVGKRTRTATIEVDYTGFPDEAVAAFERAVANWERHIQSDVTIRIDASFEDLDPTVLGGTTPQFAYAVDTDGDDTFEISVLDALADALSGEDQQPDNPDFQIVLNRSRDDWHFGEGDAPAGTIDFTSVVLHEIAHGLGYLDFTQVSNGTGEYGIDFNNNGDRTPSVFTFFLAKEEGSDSRVSLTDESEFPNPSTELGDALTSDQLVFNGATAITTAEPGNGPIPPKIYAPAEFSRGSSISHLDENTYPTETENALMTPRLRAAETNRLPGPIVCGQMKDMLWPLGDQCKQYLADVFALQFSETPDPNRGSVTISWKVRDDADPQEFIVERKYFDESFEPVKRVQASPVTIESLGLGKFEFRVRWVRSDGSEATTPQTVETTFRPQTISADVGEKDEQGRAQVSLGWAVPDGTEDFTYRVERQVGFEGSFDEVARVSGTSHTIEGQTPGKYTYQIKAADEMGNTVVSADKADVDVDFEGSVYVLGPYPNPVRNTASFDLTARDGQSVDIAIYNVAGQRLYSETRDLGAKSPEFLSIDTSRWSSGMYFLRVSGTEFTKTRRLVVTR